MGRNFIKSGGLVWPLAVRPVALFLVCFSILAAFLPLTARAQETAEVRESVDFSVEQMEGFGRVVLTFNRRFDLPPYQLRWDNGVLAVEFESPLAVTLPDVSGVLADFVVITRVDPDAKGLRFGLKSNVTINRMEAGERLFLDFLPQNWVGLPPALPDEVITELAKRAEEAVAAEDLRRRLELARLKNPQATLRVGRHPTFMRLLFDWSEDTKAEFTFAENKARLEFSWPADVDLFELISNLPPEITAASSTTLTASNVVELDLSEGVVPRFYRNSDRQFVIDIDLIDPDVEALSAEELLAEAQIEKARELLAAQERTSLNARPGDQPDAAPQTEQVELTPQVSMVGSTLRISFPFETETPAAVFRRGDLLWMVLDSPVIINAPDDAEMLSQISDDFSAVSAGDTQIVRIKLNTGRLASLGSQGRAWVLSLGDQLMAPTEPIQLARRRDEEGRFEIAANLERPVKIHQLRDPEVGDVLEVITILPPARGIVRNMNFVDFEALSSVHGLVIKPTRDDLEITLKRREAVISASDGLIVSSARETRLRDEATAAIERRSFIDLVSLIEENPSELQFRRQQLLQQTSVAVGRERQDVRLELAQVLLANRLGNETLGVLDLLSADSDAEAQMDAIMLTRAAANVVANRPGDALRILGRKSFANEVDALLWRAIARADTGDFAGARGDVLVTEMIVEGYPVWVKNRYLLAGIRAAIESDDTDLALRLAEGVEFSKLSHDQAADFELLQARIDEMEGRIDEALDTYGRVIALDVRPSRAEAIYRTIALLDRMGRLDGQKGAQTLARESIVWRGGPIEAKMLQLLAQLQFRTGDYRGGFATVKEASQTKIETEDIVALTDRAQEVFGELYLNGGADALDEIEALTLFYDYRYLTPAGARGDEMIRNLARRLIGVDLLAQAADLLEYQVDSRLEGAARAQIAADLAIVRIANREPAEAIKALNRTALAGLPPSLKRQRRILEARALLDAGRYELARDVLSPLVGREVDLLRVDAFWGEERYREAAEALEVTYSQNIATVPLSPPARMNIVKAAVGYVLAGDMLGLDRVRRKFSDRLSTTPEWGMFDFVTSALTTSSLEFRQIAAEIAGIDSLGAFLSAYQNAYGEVGSLAPVLAASL
jgi:hypothetical protein